MPHYVNNWTRVIPKVDNYNRFASLVNGIRRMQQVDTGQKFEGYEGSGEWGSDSPAYWRNGQWVGPNNNYDPADISGSGSPLDYVPPNEGVDSTPPSTTIPVAPIIPTAAVPATIPSIATPNPVFSTDRAPDWRENATKIYNPQLLQPALHANAFTSGTGRYQVATQYGANGSRAPGPGYVGGVMFGNPPVKYMGGQDKNK